MVVTVGEKLGEGVDGVLLVGGRLKAERLHNECLIVYSVHFGFLLKKSYGWHSTVQTRS